MLNDRTSAFNERKMSIKEYRKRKIKMLKNDFLIKLTDAEISHAETLTTETQLDQWALGIINKRWDK
jgi:hypothetical protein